MSDATAIAKLVLEEDANPPWLDGTDHDECSRRLTEVEERAVILARAVLDTAESHAKDERFRKLRLRHNEEMERRTVELANARAEVERLDAECERWRARVKELVCTTHLTSGDCGDRCVLCEVERLRGALESARDLIRAHRLVLGEYAGPSHIARTEHEICAALGEEGRDE